jgi:hypothetical protein
MRMNTHEEFETCRIILLRGKNPEVLLGSEGQQHILPGVEIPRWQRIAESLTAAIRKSCGMDTVSLSTLDPPPAQSGSRQMRYEIMETTCCDDEVPHGNEWVAINSLDQSEFCDPADFQAVRQAVAQCVTCAQGAACRPFGGAGWFLDLRHWVEEHGLRLNGKFSQLNASPTFSLIRFETDRRAVWFKAVGSPNQREFGVTLSLAHLFPRFVPEIIATQPACNGWLAYEAEGPLLDETSGLTSWQGVAADLAELQIQSLGKTSELLEAGAHDLRTRALSELVEPFVVAMSELTESRLENSHAALTSEELPDLAAQLQNALAILEATNMPAALGHLDLNPGNIVCTSAGGVFLDWAEVFVGHPFLTFQYLLEHLRRLNPRNLSLVASLSSAYAGYWQQLLSPDEVAAALAVSPLLALFAYTVSDDSWRKFPDPDHLANSEPLIGLLHRMKKEGNALLTRTHSCESPLEDSRDFLKHGRKCSCP